MKIHSDEGRGKGMLKGCRAEGLRLLDKNFLHILILGGEVKGCRAQSGHEDDGGVEGC